MKARYYQDEALTALYRYFATTPEVDRNPVVAMPTGTGKAVVIALWIMRVMQAWPGQRMMMLTHVKELVEQNADKLRQVWPQAPLGIYSAGLGEKNHNMPITFAGIQSARNYPELFGHIDLIIIDECHLCSPDDTRSYRAFINQLRKKNPKLRVIGLSATPYRLGLGMITDGGIFTDICYDITSMEGFNRLLDEAYLAPLIPMPTNTTLDVEGVKKQGGEFNEKDLQKAVVKYDLTKAALQEAVVAAENRNHWLIYATGIEHVHMISQILTEFGISNVMVHSNSKDYKMSDYERDDNIARFKAGQVRALINANVLTTGFDFPALDCIILLRPTNSPVLHVQILGRGTRPYYFNPMIGHNGGPKFAFDLDTLEGRQAAIAAGPKQNCLVLDFAGNTWRLGPINDPRIPKKKGPGNGNVPVKQCDSCGCLNHISARVCINCGAEFAIQEKITEKASTLALIVRDEPQVEVFKVDNVTYEKHKRPGSIASLKVSYHCGLRRFTEYVCLEHYGNPIQKKAHAWWRKRIDLEPPMTVDEARPFVDQLKTPKQIRVWVNQKYPTILAHLFEGEHDEIPT